jgi:hypothetical protein
MMCHFLFTYLKGILLDRVVIVDIFCVKIELVITVVSMNTFLQKVCLVICVVLSTNTFLYISPDKKIFNKLFLLSFCVIMSLQSCKKSIFLLFKKTCFDQKKVLAEPWCLNIVIVVYIESHMEKNLMHVPSSTITFK